MKAILISLLLAAFLLTGIACTRGGNIDEGHDGNIDNDTEVTSDNRDAVISDSIDNDVPKSRRSVEDTDNLGNRIRRGIDDLNTMTPDDLVPGDRDYDQRIVDPNAGSLPMR